MSLPASGVIYPLQYLRAIAAISVVLCHASYYLMKDRDVSWLWEIFGRAGLLGVLLFFAISGFLMAQLAPGATSLRFMSHRLIRIYPPYWICLLAVTVLSGGVIYPALTALTLAPQGTAPYILGIEWTLPFELTFYLIVCAIIALRAQAWLHWIGIGWTVLILVGVILWPQLQQGQFPLLLNLPLSTYCLAFSGGLVIPEMLRRGLVGPATPILGVCALLVNEAVPSALLGNALVCLGCVLLVAAAVRPRAAGAAPPNLQLLALGDWSYALYLCHVPVIRAVNVVLPDTTPYMAQWFAGIAAPIAVAVLFGKLDLQIYRVLKRWVDRAGVPVQAALMISFVSIILLVSGGAYWRAIQAQQASARMAPLATRLAETLQKGESGIAEAAERIGLIRDPQLFVNFDNMAPRPQVGQYVQGWAADASPAARPVQVLIFQCGRYLGAAHVGESRPDVAKVLRISRDGLGFSATIPAETCAKANLTALAVTADQHYAVTSAPAPQ